MGPGMLASNIAKPVLQPPSPSVKAGTWPPDRAFCQCDRLVGDHRTGALWGLLKYKRALTCVMVSGGLAGLFAGLTGLVRYSFGSPRYFHLASFISNNPANFRQRAFHGCHCVRSNLCLNLSLCHCREKDPCRHERASHQAQNLKSVVTGKLIPLKDVNDDVFASGSLGHGVAIARKTTSSWPQ